MNYSEMTDFEINCEVLAVIEPDVAHTQLSADQKSFYHCGYDGNGFYETAIPDYCNSWADAGPIIQQNNISLLKCERMDSWVAGSSYWVDGAEWSVDWLSDDKNPLRAAMVVFLMMQEAKNA